MSSLCCGLPFPSDPPIDHCECLCASDGSVYTTLIPHVKAVGDLGGRRIVGPRSPSLIESIFRNLHLYRSVEYDSVRPGVAFSRVQGMACVASVSGSQHPVTLFDIIPDMDSHHCLILTDKVILLMCTNGESFQSWIRRQCDIIVSMMTIPDVESVDLVWREQRIYSDIELSQYMLE